MATVQEGHNPIFARYDRWRGDAPSGYSVDFLGVKTRAAFNTMGGEFTSLGGSASLPRFDEEYFEWIDVLEAVDAAVGRFTMVELGAGYGRWLAIAAAAARQRGLRQLLIGVEAEPTHYRWMIEHLRENGVPRRATRFHKAAVARADGVATFHVGDPSSWYGQAIDQNLSLRRKPTFQERRDWFIGRFRSPGLGRGLQSVRAISLRTLLKGLDRIDLLDLDVQGVEADVLEGATDELNAKVRRVHVGTHSLENEERCRLLFSAFGWTNRNDFPSGREVETPYGSISFQDGVQTWSNSSLR